MNKYIDAEKLKKYIENKRDVVCDGLDWDDMDDSQRYAVEYIDDILDFIESIQQEHEIVEFSFKGGTYRVNGEEHPFKGGKAKVIILEINQEEEK